MLEKAGHKIYLESIADWNVVELIVHGQQVFNCDIRDLDFGDELQILVFIPVDNFSLILI